MSHLRSVPTGEIDRSRHEIVSVARFERDLPLYRGGRKYGTRLLCSCGERFTTEKAPSLGGRDNLVRLHTRHRLEAMGLGLERSIVAHPSGGCSVVVPADQAIPVERIGFSMSGILTITRKQWVIAGHDPDVFDQGKTAVIEHLLKIRDSEGYDLKKLTSNVVITTMDFVRGHRDDREGRVTELTEIEARWQKLADDINAAAGRSLINYNRIVGFTVDTRQAEELWLVLKERQ